MPIERDGYVVGFQSKWRWVNSQYQLGQSFTVQHGRYKVDAICMGGQRDGSSNYNFQYRICTDGFDADYCQSNWIPGSDVPLLGNQWIPINFSGANRKILEPGQKYYIIACADGGDSTHHILITFRDITPLYPYGKMYGSSNYGANWTVENYKDIPFIVYGTPVTSCFPPDDPRVDWTIDGNDNCSLSSADIGTKKIIGINGAVGKGCQIIASNIIKCGGLDLNDNFEFKMNDNSQLQLRD